MLEETRSDWQKKLRERRREVIKQMDFIRRLATYTLHLTFIYPPVPLKYFHHCAHVQICSQVRDLKKRQQKNIEKERLQREKLLEKERQDKELQLKAKVRRERGSIDGG